MAYTPTIITTYSEIDKDSNFLILKELLEEFQYDEIKIYSFLKDCSISGYSDEKDAYTCLIHIVKQLQNDIVEERLHTTFKDEQYYFISTDISTHTKFIQAIFNYCEIDYFTDFMI